MPARPVTGRRTGTRGPAGASVRRQADGSMNRVVRIPEDPFNSLKIDSTGENIPTDLQEN